MAIQFMLTARVSLSGLYVLIQALSERWWEQSFELGECVSGNIWIADVSDEELSERVFAVRDPAKSSGAYLQAR